MQCEDTGVEVGCGRTCDRLAREYKHWGARAEQAEREEVREEEAREEARGRGEEANRAEQAATEMAHSGACDVCG